MEPPKSATLGVLVKPVTTEVPVQNLELDERRSGVVCSFSFLFYLSSNPHVNAGSSETFHRGVRSRNSRLVGPLSDITTSKEKHGELYTFMYAPRKVCHPLLVHLSVKRLAVTMFPYPLNRTFGIGRCQDFLGLSRTGTCSFLPLHMSETHAITCLLGSTRCCTLV